MFYELSMQLVKAKTNELYENVLLKRHRVFLISTLPTPYSIINHNTKKTGNKVPIFIYSFLQEFDQLINK